jgi:valyl-tRNA synthetase
MFAENINFNNNVRKVLKQIIYEIYKFNKMTTAILQEKNKDAARAILSSPKFENYVTGIQILQAFCSELQGAFQFIELGNKWFNKYYKAIEDLTQKVDGLKNQIREEFSKEFPAQVLTQENSKSAEWLGEIQKLDKEALRHICHLSLRLNDSQLTEYSGNYYFLPYLNFLLNIE